MSIPFSSIQLRILLAGLFSITLLGWVAAGCGASPESRLKEFVPELMDQTSQILVQGTDGELRQWFVDKGESDLQLEFGRIVRAFNFGSPQERDFLLPFITRLGRILDEEFLVGMGSYLPRYLAQLPSEILDEAHRLNQERERLRFDSTTPDTIKIRRFWEIQAFYKRHGNIPNEIVLLADVAQLQAGLGHHEEARTNFLEALGLSEEIDFAWMTCQILGILAAMEGQEGRVDESREYLDRLSRRAKSSRMANQAARAEVFRGNRAAKEGRLGSAYLHYQEARDLCRRFKGGENEVRYINTLVDFYRRLDCWKIVERLVAQADALKRGEGSPKQKSTRENLAMAKAEAMYMKGEIDQALELATRVVNGVQPRPLPQVYAGVYLRHARILFKSGRLGKAQPVIAKGLARSVEDHMPGLERSFRLLLAAVLERQGRYEEAWRRLQEVRWNLETPTGPMPDDIRDEVLLELRLCRARFGDGPELAAATVRALQVLQKVISAGRPSVHTYLQLQAFDDLRWVLHELILDDPRLGYEFDMAWRGLTRVKSRGIGFTPETGFGRGREVVVAWIQSRRNGQSETNWNLETTHLLFVVTETDIIRWRRNGPRISRDVLGWSPHEMRVVVARALNGLCRPPGNDDGTIPISLQDDLTVLRERLIPADLLAEWERAAQSGITNPIWISADDALTRIPFSTFDLDPGRNYRPLLDIAAIGYLRYAMPKGNNSGTGKTESLVVGDPIIDPDLNRRLNGLVPLQGARAEALAVSAAWSSNNSFIGDRATKANILANWDRAGRIYIAAHHDRDPEAPYLTMIPLAGDLQKTRMEDVMLEATDILPVDLDGCDLVVLSGCSSGAPYVEGSRVAPGLGDAFLDAGCRSTVQTLWGVDDQVTLDLMTGFLGGICLKLEESYSVAALHEAKRMVVGRGGGLGHPFYWAPYCLVTTGY